jgi:hypothetical protein
LYCYTHFNLNEKHIYEYSVATGSTQHLPNFKNYPSPMTGDSLELPPGALVFYGNFFAEGALDHNLALKLTDVNMLKTSDQYCAIRKSALIPVP